MTFEEWMEVVVHGFEIVGVAILVAGSIVALAGFILALARGQREGAFERVRQGVGRAILLGLEVLIVDIVLTITVEATVESALTLGLVVLVRTFLSFSLEIELEGTPMASSGETYRSSMTIYVSDLPGTRITQRKPMWAVDVSTSSP